MVPAAAGSSGDDVWRKARVALKTNKTKRTKAR